MGEWLLPVGVSGKKKKQDQPLGGGGWGARAVLLPNPKTFQPHLTFSESKENICSLRQQSHSAK